MVGVVEVPEQISDISGAVQLIAGFVYEGEVAVLESPYEVGSSEKCLAARRLGEVDRTRLTDHRLFVLGLCRGL